jgi:hypothetical protein
MVKMPTDHHAVIMLGAVIHDGVGSQQDEVATSGIRVRYRDRDCLVSYIMIDSAGVACRNIIAASQPSPGIINFRSDHKGLSSRSADTLVKNEDLMLTIASSSVPNRSRRPRRSRKFERFDSNRPSRHLKVGRTSRPEIRSDHPGYRRQAALER